MKILAVNSLNQFVNKPLFWFENAMLEIKNGAVTVNIPIIILRIIYVKFIYTAIPKYANCKTKPAREPITGAPAALGSACDANIWTIELFIFNIN